MTPRQWVEALDSASGGHFGTTHVANLADGLAELLAAREPAKVESIGVGTRFRYANGGEWVVVPCGNGYNMVQDGRTWWGLGLGGVSLVHVADTTKNANFWTRLSDDPDHAAEVARLTAELAAMTTKAAEAMARHGVAHDGERLASKRLLEHEAMLRDRNGVIDSLLVDNNALAKERDEAIAARDHAEARTAELEAAIRVLIGKVQA